LEAYRNGELTKEEIFSDESAHIRSITLDVYYFADKEVYVDVGFDEMFKKIQREYTGKGIWLTIKARGYKESVLQEKSFEEIRAIDHPLLYLESISDYSCKSNYPPNKFHGSGGDTDLFKNPLTELEERHKEKFIYTRYDDISNSYIYAPVRDLSLEFEYSFSYGSKYPAVMVQKMVSKRIREAIDFAILTRCVSITSVSIAKVCRAC
jgi:hypothetical protein